MRGKKVLQLPSIKAFLSCVDKSGRKPNRIWLNEVNFTIDH